MMERDDSTLLHEPDLMLAVLRMGSVKPATLDECIDHLRVIREAAQIDEPMPEGEVRDRLAAAQAKLHRARLIEVPAPSRATAAICHVTE